MLDGKNGDPQDQETTESRCTPEARRTLCNAAITLNTAIIFAVLEMTIKETNPWVHFLLNLVIGLAIGALLTYALPHVKEDVKNKFADGELSRLADKFGIHSASNTPGEKGSLLPDGGVVDDGQTSYQPG